VNSTLCAALERCRVSLDAGDAVAGLAELEPVLAWCTVNSPVTLDPHQVEAARAQLHACRLAAATVRSRMELTSQTIGVSARAARAYAR